MKSLVIIPVVVAALIGVWAACLDAVGVHVHAADPIAAGALVIVGALLGVLPIIIRRKAGPAEVWQAALAGTVIHLLVTVAGAAILMTVGIVSWRGQFPYWLIASYWTSLVLLTKQVRQLALKVH